MGMMKVSITSYSVDLTDADLRQLSQLGVDCIDFGKGVDHGDLNVKI